MSETRKGVPKLPRDIKIRVRFIPEPHCESGCGEHEVIASFDNQEGDEEGVYVLRAGGKVVLQPSVLDPSPPCGCGGVGGVRFHEEVEECKSPGLDEEEETRYCKPQEFTYARLAFLLDGETSIDVPLRWY